MRETVGSGVTGVPYYSNLLVLGPRLTLAAIGFCYKLFQRANTKLFYHTINEMVNNVSITGFKVEKEYNKPINHSYLKVQT